MNFAQVAGGDQPKDAPYFEVANSKPTVIG